MDPEQVWAQLELRAEGLCRIIKEVAQPENDEEEGSVMGWEEEEDEEEDSTEDMTVEEWEKMMAEGGYEEGMSDEEMGSDEEDSDEDDEEDEEMGSDEEGLDLGSEDEDGLLDEDEDGEGEEEDDEDEDEVADGSGSDAADDDDEDAYAPGPSKPRKPQHPTLDDQFFSIDEFNRQTEEMEAGRVTSGALGGDEDEEAELDDMGALFLEEGEDDDAPLMYSDFFEAPPRPAEPPSKKGKGKEREVDGKKKKKSRVTFEDDAEEPEEAEEVDPSRDIMDRVKADLFDDSEDEGDEAQGE